MQPNSAHLCVSHILLLSLPCAPQRKQMKGKQTSKQKQGKQTINPKTKQKQQKKIFFVSPSFRPLQHLFIHSGVIGGFSVPCSIHTSFSHQFSWQMFISMSLWSDSRPLVCSAPLSMERLWDSLWLP